MTGKKSSHNVKVKITFAPEISFSINSIIKTRESLSKEEDHLVLYKVTDNIF